MTTGIIDIESWLETKSEELQEELPEDAEAIGALEVKVIQTDVDDFAEVVQEKEPEAEEPVVEVPAEEPAVEVPVEAKPEVTAEVGEVDVSTDAPAVDVQPVTDKFTNDLDPAPKK